MARAETDDRAVARPEARGAAGTQLLERETMMAALRDAFARAAEKGLPLTVALADVDRFGELNAQHGSEAGDRVLAAVARALEQAAPDDAMLGRFGGDQFLLVFPGREPEEVFLFLERAREHIAGRPVRFGSRGRPAPGAIRVTVSFGVAGYMKDGLRLEEVLRKADGALYRAKVLGRNRVGLPQEERMITKTSHYPQSQLERLKALARREGVGEAELLREALDDLLLKHRDARRPS